MGRELHQSRFIGGETYAFGKGVRIAANSVARRIRHRDLLTRNLIVVAVSTCYAPGMRVSLPFFKRNRSPRQVTVLLAKLAIQISTATASRTGTRRRKRI